MLASDLAALAVPVASLTLLPGNPRRGDVDAIVRSLARFGQRKPIVAKRDGTVVAGNHTLQAVQQLGWDEIAVVWVDDDEATAQAFALADNRTAELGGYDEAALLELIEQVREVDPELLADAGWLPDAVAALEASLVEELPPAALTDPDEVPEPPAEPVTKPGDLWLLGPHRVLAGDCRTFSDVERLLDAQRIAVAFTSPPYASQRAYDESSGFKPIPPDEYVDWFEDVQANVRAVLAEDGSWFVNISPGAEDRQRRRYVLDLVLAHLDRWAWRFLDEYCWPRGGMPLDPRQIGRFKIGFEMVYAFAVSERCKFRPDAVMHESDSAFTYEGVGNRISNDYQGTADSSARQRARTTVGPGRAYPSTLLPSFGNAAALGHEAAFPVGLPGWFVKTYSDPGDAILDPFLGSGSTLIAAHQEGRIGYGLEISPAYVDVACIRWQRLTGTKPILEATGEPHDFTRETEHAEPAEAG